MGQQVSYFTGIDPERHRAIDETNNKAAAEKLKVKKPSGSADDQYENLPDYDPAAPHNVPPPPPPPPPAKAKPVSPSIRAPDNKFLRVPADQQNYQTLYGLNNNDFKKK